MELSKMDEHDFRLETLVNQQWREQGHVMWPAVKSWRENSKSVILLTVGCIWTQVIHRHVLLIHLK